MELKINLLEIHKKSWWRVLVGIAFILLSLIWLFGNSGNDQTISAYDWIYFSVMLLNGAFHTFWGLGYSGYKYFGNAHIIVDAKKISVKPTITAKNQSILWDDVQSIFYKSNGFRIIRNNGAIFNLTLDDLDYSHINKIKETVKQIAESRKVNYE